MISLGILGKANSPWLLSLMPLLRAARLAPPAKSLYIDRMSSQTQALLASAISAPLLSTSLLLVGLLLRASAK